MKCKGVFGETLACTYLAAKGYMILDRNWICALGELDIVCRDAKMLVFVEVKYRASDSFCDVCEVLTYAKRLRLQKAINVYLTVKSHTEVSWRLDFIGIVGATEPVKIYHYLSILG